MNYKINLARNIRFDDKKVIFEKQIFVKPCIRDPVIATASILSESLSWQIFGGKQCSAGYAYPNILPDITPI